MRIVSTLRRRFFPPAVAIEGYEHPELVDVVFRKTLAYQRSEAVWPETASASTVLDFGGGCGVHYKQAQSPARWAVVETPAMVARAQDLATDRLRFFATIAEAVSWLGTVDVMHSNGAIQYVPDPLKALEDLCETGAKKMLWRRVTLSPNSTVHDVQTTYLADNGPGRIEIAEDKIARYARTHISEWAFLRAHERYSLVDRGADFFTFAIRE